MVALKCIATWRLLAKLASVFPSVLANSTKVFDFYHMLWFKVVCDKMCELRASLAV